MVITPDSGASKLIADGRIKIKNGTGISKITRTGIAFEDGTETVADVIIFATGSVFYLAWLIPYKPVSQFGRCPGHCA